MSDVTQILAQIDSGDQQAAEQLLPLVYDELRRLAAAKLAHEKPGQTLQPTALVHEAYLRLVGSAGQEPGTSGQKPVIGDERLATGSGLLAPGGWDSRGHFFAAAAEAMRRILVESARRKKRVKHGGSRKRVDLEEQDVPVNPRSDEILALDEALTRLSTEDPMAAQVVQLHFFAGLPIEKAAELLGLSRATAYRQWIFARAWLRCTLGEGGDSNG